MISVKNFKMPYPNHGDENEESIELQGKIYLLSSYERCYRCNDIATVFCLASEELIDHDLQMDIGGFFTFSCLKAVTENIAYLLKECAPTYYIDYTRASNDSYYVNHCHCGAKLGDHFLHNEPDSAFYPTNKEDAKNLISIHQIITNTRVVINANYRTDDCEYILKYANIIGSYQC